MQDAFFSLLRSGLWGTQADVRLFGSLSAADWDELYLIARKQALIALIFDGVNTLPAGLRPPHPLYLQWATQTVRIEQANRRLNGLLPEIDRIYRGAGLHPVLLKGQGMGVYYRNPLHRQCGDIDIYIGKKGLRTANRLLTEQGAVQKGEGSRKHVGLVFRGVLIENHHILFQLNNPCANRYLQGMIGAWHPHGAEAGTLGMPVPPVGFNALFIFLHAFGHFMNGGIGLRQLCDWACLLRQRHEEIDAPDFCRQLKRFGLLRAARAFGYIAVAYLGLPASCLPFVPCEEHEADEALRGEQLLREILATGNFGYYDMRVPSRPQGYWAGKWYTFRRIVRRCNEFRGFAPAEAFWYVVMAMRDSLGVQLKRLFRACAMRVSKTGKASEEMPERQTNCREEEGRTGRNDSKGIYEEACKSKHIRKSGIYLNKHQHRYGGER
ncbi:hypothetical protein EII33_01475 [Bacteroides heparinolyticus]|uniref:Uncharacterized protein n=1 Tax=Prevotella heparinolytica TaxID=28113 RepID=A0A3P2AHM2_9BACE|nr:hypothetical protein EII33_01475 [Bacteroides heparinolyticus]